MASYAASAFGPTSVTRSGTRPPTHEALTDLIPQFTDLPPDGHRHHAMRNHLASLDLLRQDLNALASLIDTRRRTCTELRIRLDKGPYFGQDHATAHDLAAAEKDLRSLERRYADTHTEFALSVTLGRTFDQVRNPPPPDATPATWHTAGAAPRPSDFAVGGVVLLFPAGEVGLASLAAVRDDQASAPVAAVGDDGGLADGVLGAVAPDSSHALQSLRLPSTGRPTATTSRVSASITTWWLVEYR